MTAAVSNLLDACAAVRGATCWIVTDGKAGDEVQCLGVAERLRLTPEIRRVQPRAPHVWLMPWGGIDPAERPGAAGSPLSPPFPDIAIASGRRAAPYLRFLKRASGGRTFTVFLKDPRSGCGTADFLWVPEHDRLRGPNVLATLTSPHRISPERLAAARAAPPYGLERLPSPRVALLVGGNSRHFSFNSEAVDDFAESLRALAGTGASLMATASRRTPPALLAAVADSVRQSGGFLWDGAGENPYLSLLALADAIVVTADSVNMVGEAAATGRPILLFTPSGGSAKVAQFLRGLEVAGALRPFAGRLEGTTYEPLDSTPVIAAELARRYRAHRTGLGS